MEQAKPITHAELVQALAKPGQDIAEDLKERLEHKVVLLSAAYEMVRQANLLDRAKKQAIYNKVQGIRAVHMDLSDSKHPHVRADISPKQADLLHMAVGIAGEAGELLEAVLTHILTNDEIDTENVIEELGDIEFFMEGFRQNQNITRDETISNNISKLSIRYGSGSYSDNEAQSRADKSGE